MRFSAIIDEYQRICRAGLTLQTQSPKRKPPQIAALNCRRHPPTWRCLCLTSSLICLTPRFPVYSCLTKGFPVLQTALRKRFTVQRPSAVLPPVVVSAHRVIRTVINRRIRIRVRPIRISRRRTTIQRSVRPDRAPAPAASLPAAVTGCNRHRACQMEAHQRFSRNPDARARRSRRSRYAASATRDRTNRRAGVRLPTAPPIIAPRRAPPTTFPADAPPFARAFHLEQVRLQRIVLPLRSSDVSSNASSLLPVNEPFSGCLTSAITPRTVGPARNRQNSAERNVLDHRELDRLTPSGLFAAHRLIRPHLD